MSQLCFLIADLSGIAESMPSPRHIHNLHTRENYSLLHDTGQIPSPGHAIMCVQFTKTLWWWFTESDVTVHPPHVFSASVQINHFITRTQTWAENPGTVICKRHALTPLNGTALLSCSWLHVLSDRNSDRSSYQLHSNTDFPKPRWKLCLRATGQESTPEGRCDWGEQQKNTNY